jgi:hypothetical protein
MGSSSAAQQSSRGLYFSYYLTSLAVSRLLPAIAKLLNGSQKIELLVELVHFTGRLSTNIRVLTDPRRRSRQRSVWLRVPVSQRLTATRAGRAAEPPFYRRLSTNIRVLMDSRRRSRQRSVWLRDPVSQRLTALQAAKPQEMSKLER